MQKISLVSDQITSGFRLLNRNLMLMMKLIVLAITLGSFIVGGLKLFSSLYVGGQNGSENTTRKVILDLESIQEVMNKIDSKLDALPRKTRSLLSSDLVDLIAFAHVNFSKCVYWLPDCNGMVLPKIVAERNLTFSLHGV